jgi:hypothetical protein
MLAIESPPQHHVLAKRSTCSWHCLRLATDSFAAGRQKFGDKLHRVNVHCREELEQLNNVKPTFSALHSANEGLRLPDRFGKFHLSHATRFTSLHEQPKYSFVFPA